MATLSWWSVPTREIQASDAAALRELSGHGEEGIEPAMSTTFSALIGAARSAVGGARKTWRRVGPSGLLPLFRQNLAVRARPSWVDPRINALQLEPTKRCNEKCPMCVQPTLSEAETGDMSFEQFKQIIEQFPHVTEVKLQGLGEIFLNRDIWKMLEYLVSHDIRVLFATNGLLMKADAAERIIKLRNIDVRFSFDSLVRERYARIRGVDAMELVQRNIRQFAELRRKKGIRRSGRWEPSAELRMVCMDENYQELPDMMRFAADAGIERVTATLMLVKKHSEQQREFTKGKADTIASMPIEQIVAKAREEGKSIGVGLKILPYADDILKTCEWPWRMPYITFDGYVTTCCHVEDPKVGNLGNILETPFEDIWNGSSYRALREHFTDLSKNELCRVCPYLKDEQVRPYAKEQPSQVIPETRLVRPADAAHGEDGAR